MLCRVTSEAERVGRASAGAADHQRRGCVPAQAAGAGSALHPVTAGAGHGSEALGNKAGRARWKERKEKSDCGSGAKTGNPAAPFMGDGRSLRATEKQSGDGESRLRVKVLMS